MDALRTRLCEMLGVEVPVVQAPIGSASCPELATAVSDAGGLGMLAHRLPTTGSRSGYPADGSLDSGQDCSVPSRKTSASLAASASLAGV